MNKIIILGNLGKDPELRYTPDGTPTAKFSVAVSRRWKQNDELKEETTWFNCVTWRKTAEYASQYLHKGSRVLLEGRMTFRKWTSPEGEEKSTWEIQVANIENLTPKPNGDQPQEARPEPARKPSAPAEQPKADNSLTDADFDGGEIPF